MSKETKIKNTFSTKRKTISPKTKKLIVDNQYYRCANCPFKPAINLSNYKCPFWIYNNGLFDNSGFAIDHINEVSITGNNELENLQALCHNCHAVKTRIFKENKTAFTSTQLYNGSKLMDVDKPAKKKRKIE